MRRATGAEGVSVNGRRISLAKCSRNLGWIGLALPPRTRERPAWCLCNRCQKNDHSLLGKTFF
jgi:hypothetical protein